MRKNDARKWLHAVLDLLPVLLIPVFMIYSHRHTINDYQIDFAENKIVDFNQIVVPRSFSGSDSVFQGLTYSCSDYLYTLNGTKVNGNQYSSLITSNSFVDSHKYLYKTVPFMSWQSHVLYFNVGGKSFTSEVGIFQYADDGAIGNLTLNVINNATFDNYSFYFNCFDLTQMFGVGNEPSVEQFVNWYPNNYYDYTLSHKELLKNYQTVIYNNTDIGSQLLYSIYIPVHDYMNFNNVFNFGQIYDWLQFNIFGGTAPMSVFIVWNIIVYEFIMDLIFLLYSLFMFFIDFCVNLIDRFHTKCSGGK